MVASYSELYEEGEVEHINGPSHPPNLLTLGWVMGMKPLMRLDHGANPKAEVATTRVAFTSN